ncbi:hypothetical protein OROGR_027760 [Orobanche gracilis]
MEGKSQPSSNKYAADISSIKAAQDRIRSYMNKTPVLCSETLDSRSGRKLYFKCECFQKGGAFKFRGACNAVFSLTDDEAARGVVTHSRPVVQDLVDDIIVVEDKEIIETMRLCYEILRVAVAKWSDWPCCCSIGQIQE